MKRMIGSRRVISVGAAVALLSGCGGSQPPIAAPDAMPPATLTTHLRAFSYTGAKQTFVVPRGVTRIAVVALGAAGSGHDSVPCDPDRDCFGRGGRVYAEIPVKPREKLYVYVGGKGKSAAGGFNGGGDAGTPGRGRFPGYGGGGASDVREGDNKLKDRVLVAAGGGGQGGPGSALSLYYDSSGGNGGGKDGESGTSPFGGGGGGGSQTQGGAGGAPGTGSGSGSPGQPGSRGALGLGGSGGNGANAGSSGYSGGAGGGGGGGYYGGGGGAGGGASLKSSELSATGGGGSSWAERRAKHFRTWSGWISAKGNGLVVFSWH